MLRKKPFLHLCSIEEWKKTVFPAGGCLQNASPRFPHGHKIKVKPWAPCLCFCCAKPHQSQLWQDQRILVLAARNWPRTAPVYPPKDSAGVFLDLCTRAFIIAVHVLTDPKSRGCLPRLGLREGGRGTSPRASPVGTEENSQGTRYHQAGVWIGPGQEIVLWLISVILTMTSLVAGWIWAT